MVPHVGIRSLGLIEVEPLPATAHATGRAVFDRDDCDDATLERTLTYLALGDSALPAAASPVRAALFRTRETFAACRAFGRSVVFDPPRWALPTRVHADLASLAVELEQALSHVRSRIADSRQPE